MIPIELHLIASLQLLAGLSAIGNIVGELIHGQVYLDFSVCGVGAYFGLLRGDPKWRTWTLAMTWVWLIGTPLLLVFGLDPETPVSVSAFGADLGSVWPGWLSVIAVPLFLYALWQYRVLTRPDVSVLFLHREAARTAPVGFGA